MRELILAEYNSERGGLVQATATDTVENKFTLTVSYFGGCDPGDVVEVELEYHPGFLTMDGLRVEEQHGLAWLDRLIRMKREEQA